MSGSLRARLRPSVVLGALAGLGLLLIVIKAALAFQSSRALQQPPRGPTPRSVELSAVTALEDASYTLDAGVTIRGWYAPSRSGMAVLFVHGQPGTRNDLVPEARALARAGHGALLIDLPGHGESGGRPTWGNSARAAVTGGLDFLARRCEVDPQRLGVYGFSYGSSLVARVATEDRRIRALVMAGTFTSARDQIEYAYGDWGPLTSWPGIWGAEWDGLKLADLNPMAVASRIAPTPTLHIAGTEDIVVPFAMTREVFERAREPKWFFSVAGAHHGDYGKVLGRPYFERVTRFFERTLPARSSAEPPPAVARGLPCVGPGARAKLR